MEPDAYLAAVCARAGYPVSVDGGKFDLRLLRDLLDGFGADAADLPGNHARVRVGSKRLDDARPLFRRKSFSFFRIFRRKPYIRLFGDLTDRSRAHVADFSGDPACVRVGFQRLDDARPRLGRKPFPFPYRRPPQAGCQLFWLSRSRSTDRCRRFPGRRRSRSDLFFSASAIFSRASGESFVRPLWLGLIPSWRAMTPTVARLTPPTCLATAAQFGLLCSALRICVRFAWGIMARLERRATAITRPAGWAPCSEVIFLAIDEHDDIGVPLRSSHRPSAPFNRAPRLIRAQASNFVQSPVERRSRGPQVVSRLQIQPEFGAGSEDFG